MPASFMLDRAPVGAGLSQPMSLHNSVMFHHHSHEASIAAAGCAMTSRQSNGGTASSQFALQELVNFAAANLNLTSSADADGTASTSPVLGRSVSACSPSSSASSSSGSIGPIAADGPVSSASVHGGSSNRKSANMTECVPVPSSEHVAEIVGRQGSKIKALRNKTNTYIKTPVRGEEPVFVVTGRREDVAAAKREILSASEHFSQIRASRLGTSSGSSPLSGVSSGSIVGSPRPVSTAAAALPTSDVPGQVTIQVRVPYRVVGLVVGPKGATIKRIQQDSATYIVTPSRDREPVFEVTGTPEGVEKARQDIASYIAQRTGSNSEPETEHLGGANSVMDARMLFGSVLKMGASQNLNNNNDPLALMTSYNNALNHLGPSRLMASSDYDGLHQQMVGVNDNETRFANTMMLRAALEQSMLSSSKNNANSETSSTWPSSGATDQILRSLMSLFPGDEDHQSPAGSGNGKCGLLSVAMPPYDDQSARRGGVMVDCGVPVPHHDYNSSAVNPMDMAFHVQQQQFANCPRGGGSGSVGDSSMSSASPTDSTSDAIHRMTHFGPSGFPSGSLLAGCCLCSESPVTSALVPCGHNLFCKNCADGIVSRPEREDRRCPVCGESASLAIRILS